MFNKIPPIRRPLAWIVLAYIVILAVILAQGPEHPAAAYLYGAHRERFVEETTDTFSAQLTLVEINTYGKKVEMKVTEGQWKGLRFSSYWNEQIDPVPGMVIRVTGEIRLPEKSSNEGQFNAWLYYKTRKVDYLLTIQNVELIKESRFLSAFFYQFRGRMQSAIWELLPEKEAGLVCSILLGTDEGLDPDVKQLFQATGIAHILAISGLHVMLLFKGFYGVSAKWFGPRKAAVFSLIILWAYCFFTGGSVSTIRATLMLSMQQLAFLKYEKEDPVITIASAAGILLVIQPLYLLNAGFQLSFTAVIGLRILPPVFERCFWIPGRVRRSVAASLSATAATAPVSLWHFYQICPYGFMLNLIVIPLMSFVFAFSFLAIIFSALSLSLARLCMGPVYYILQLYQWLSEWVAAWPGSIWTIGRPTWWQMVAFYGICVLSVVYCGMTKEQRTLWKQRGIVALIGMGLFLIPDLRKKEITFLNVGQGDCSVIQWQNRVYLVDAGPAYDEVIKPFLLHHGITRIDGIFLSHTDADHFEGVESLLADEIFSVSHFYLSDYEWEDAEAETEFMQALVAAGVSCHRLSAGDQVYLPGATVQCVAPRDDLFYTSVNEASLVFRWFSEELAVLYTGDMEEQAENAVSAEYLSADIIKVAHHGSRTSSSELFLEKVSPQYGIISSKKSVYGHPHDETLERLKNQGISYMITEEAGSITIKVGWFGYDIDTYAGGVFP